MRRALAAAESLYFSVRSAAMDKEPTTKEPLSKEALTKEARAEGPLLSSVAGKGGSRKGSSREGSPVASPIMRRALQAAAKVEGGGGVHGGGAAAEMLRAVDKAEAEAAASRRVPLGLQLEKLEANC